MNQNIHYLIVKNKDTKEIVYMEYDKLTGYDITPKNKQPIQDCIKVNRMILIQPTLIQKLVHKKVDKHFKKLLLLVQMLLNSDDDTGTALYEALNEIEKFRIEIKNNYRMYMQKEELNLIAKKLTILKEEIKNRIIMLDVKAPEQRGKQR